MTIMETSPSQIIDIEGLSFTSGAHMLIKRALRDLPAGGRLGVRTASRDFTVHLRGWCRAQGHEYLEGSEESIAWILRGEAASERWSHAERAGKADSGLSDAVMDAPSANWGRPRAGRRSRREGRSSNIDCGPKNRFGPGTSRNYMLRRSTHSGTRISRSTGKHHSCWTKRLRCPSFRS
jgi:TusA-related sulfurtransferase